MVKLFLKNSYLCDHNSPTSQTDGRTDRQTTCDRNTALCTKVHRAVKSKQHKTQQNKKNYPGSVAFYNIWPGNEVGYRAHAGRPLSCSCIILSRAGRWEIKILPPRYPLYSEADVAQAMSIKFLIVNRYGR